MRIRPTYSGVAATLALVVAVSSGAYAATALPKNSVGTPQLKAHAVTGAKIASHTITTTNLSSATVSGLRGKTGPAGAPGPKGAPGGQGAPGPSLWLVDASGAKIALVMDRDSDGTYNGFAGGLLWTIDSNQGLLMPMSSTGTVYFTTSDCTGTGYWSTSAGGSPGLLPHPTQETVTSGSVAVGTPVYTPTGAAATGPDGVDGTTTPFLAQMNGSVCQSSQIRLAGANGNGSGVPVAPAGTIHAPYGPLELAQK
jgi:hypothetical protein